MIALSNRLSPLVVLLATLAAAAPAAQAKEPGVVIDSVNLQNFQVAGNVLTADGTVTGTLNGLPFTTDITNFALQLVADDPMTQQVECSVLDLELGPINLALLGLFVDTSPICLEITAIEGGGLLGDLLCGLAGGGLLGGGIPVLPVGDQAVALEGGLAEILNGTLGGDLEAAEHNEESVCTGECEVLELAVGPLDLTLLGLNVYLHDCEDGPVQVCVSASEGDGILGNLLCGLAGGDLLNLDLGDITRLITRAVAALADGNLSEREIDQLTRLLARLVG